ncbi:MAG: glycoside hydrolase family 2 TIM barrel-domain containing protein [Bacteroidales bacterium]
MYKMTLSLLLCGLSLPMFSVQDSLAGFNYGRELSPLGDEWNSPEKLALNKEQPRAYFFSFENVDNARKFLPENSKYWKSLNGEWDFNWSPDPESRPTNFYQTDFNSSAWDKIKVPSNWNIEGIQKDGSLKYGVPIYVNQPVIFQHKVAVDDWKGGVMRTPPAHWTTFKHRNEVGSYRREFQVPNDWDGREIFISFDGVDSFFYLWINGQYVGFSKNSRNTANFNITPYLNKGKNIIAAEVYRSSDASFLEAQDMFRLPGIFRTVAIFASPKVHISNFKVIPDLDENYKDGVLNITTDIRNLGKSKAKAHTVEYSLYEHKLYSDENSKVSNAIATSKVDLINANQVSETSTQLKVTQPKKWSAEEPYRYTLVAELKDAKGRSVDVTSTIIGFREVEIKETPASEDEFGLAGRYFYVNGKPVKLKGVNRHESNPETGHVISRELMKKEIMLMKQGNINHVRNSHYPDDPYWYFLCDKYGIYLEDEANIESHQYYYGAASLSHPKEWEKAHVARVMEMVNANINNASIVIWSLGNEAGPGDNFVTAYNALKRYDKSRPVQYERNNSIVDMGSNQYPSIAWTREAVKGKYNIKYPFHISEYAHSMGNACGNLVDYWDAIESTNFFCGAAIWDWVDQSMYAYTKTGERYFAYGGDFGDTPNDGQFVMNGIVFGDLTPKPQYYEVKKVYQNVGIKAKDLERGQFEVFNKYYFMNLNNHYSAKWLLYENGELIKSGDLNLGDIPARKAKTITLPYDYSKLNPQSEYFVKIQLQLEDSKPWADKGYVQAEEQFELKSPVNRASISEVAMQGGKLVISDLSSNIKAVKGDNFEAQFDVNSGTIHKLAYGSEVVIEEGKGPKLDAMRAFVNNDNWFYSQWFEKGLHNLKHVAKDVKVITKADGRIVLSFVVESQAPNGAKILGGTSSGKNSIEENIDRKFGEEDFKFTTSQIWTIYKDGSIELQSSINSNHPSSVLPRLGYIMEIPQRYDDFTYYGRGPIGNYNDRKTSQFVEIHKSKVQEQFVNFPKPQEVGNHEEVRWSALTNQTGKGAIFIATGNMSTQALPYSAVDMILASHPHQLPKAKDTYLRLDMGVTGLGGNSCGQGGPLEKDRIFAKNNNMGFIIRPVSSSKQLPSLANVTPAGDLPISITRTRSGDVKIESLDSSSTILYKLNRKGKTQEYKEPIALREGGTIEAWYKETPEIKITSSFERIRTTPLEVTFASSEEIGEGNATNLTDGDPNSIWHTMYSVTVAKHPHWVDLDAGEEKSIIGFTLLPRQDGANGRINAYQIQVSADGKEWGDPIIKGNLPNNTQESRTMFNKAVKGRYIRFTALSSHSKQDFASAAEIGIITE